MANPIRDRRILLGVTGSIAAYKAVDLASKLTQAGGIVDVILTAAAQQFVTPLSFQSVTGRRAYTDADLWGHEGHVQHISLGHAADLLMIAPVSANTLARLAHGLADNLLCVTALAAACPLVLAPAMDGGMFAHPATQANLEALRARGAIIVGPATGHLASGLSGVGRMVEPVELLGAARLALARGGPLQGRRVVVTAGGTYEPIDPVRVIANRSSGKQGYALAQAALDLGAAVTLISGPSALPAPYGAQRLDVRTSAEMLQATLDAVRDADALLMAAAVADFRPVAPAANKMKKEGGPPQITLEHTADVLRQVAVQKERCGRPFVTVGFAAESQALLENAAAKLEKKKLDMIAANDITAADSGFAADDNRVTLLFADGRSEALPLMSKDAVAERILGHVARFLEPSSWIVHICEAQAWQAARQAGEYRAGSLASEGFIHASLPDQALATANRFFAGAPPLALLWIAPQDLHAPVKFDPVGADAFPHIYGPVNLDAVRHVTPFPPDADGVFRHLPQPGE